MATKKQKEAARKNIKKAQARWHAQRLAGKKSSGSWDDQAWLISKEDAHVGKGKLVADSSVPRKILDVIGPIRHPKGDVFQGRPRRNVPEKEKPPPAQRRARMENIRKAQEARRKTT